MTVPAPDVASPTAVDVTLSTASCFPLDTDASFAFAAAAGYDGVEVMVWTDPVTQDGDALESLVQRHGLPVRSVHAPCLLLTQRVWGADPWVKIEKSRDLAERLGATTVVIHPPFRWQRDYAKNFVQGLARLQQTTEVALAVENMFPWRAGGRTVQAYAPVWDPTDLDVPHLVLDLSHTATANVDGFAMLQAMGARLNHLHLADGLGSSKDEHLVPGRGSQPCDRVLQRLVQRGFAGSVVVEISTRRALNREERERDVVESLAYARSHLAAPVP